MKKQGYSPIIMGEKAFSEKDNMGKSGNFLEDLDAVFGGYGQINDIEIRFCFESRFRHGGGDTCAVVGRSGRGAVKDILQMLVFSFLFGWCLRIMEHGGPPFWNMMRAVDKSSAF